jgi:hypothetical protein
MQNMMTALLTKNHINSKAIKLGGDGLVVWLRDLSSTSASSSASSAITSKSSKALAQDLVQSSFSTISAIRSRAEYFDAVFSSMLHIKLETATAQEKS